MGRLREVKRIGFSPILREFEFNTTITLPLLLKLRTLYVNTARTLLIPCYFSIIPLRVLLRS
jgi:hypothetical protein